MALTVSTLTFSSFNNISEWPLIYKIALRTTSHQIYHEIKI